MGRRIDGWRRRLQGAVHLLESFQLVSAAGTGRQVASGLFRFLWFLRAEYEGRQVGMTLWIIHRIATRQASPSASSSRRLLKAFAVLVFTVPRGTPVRREISLWESPPK